jgi:hypothetical protein
MVPSQTSATSSAPLGWSTRLSTATAWVWSTNLCGRKACSSVSTDGLGARESNRLVRWKLTMSSSASLSRVRSLRSGASFTAGRPAGSMVPMSQPEP